MTNCPNCGAPITSWKCEYCGTEFPDRKQTISYPVYNIKTGKYITTLLDKGLISPNKARSMLLEETKQLQEQENMKRIYQNAIDAMKKYKQSKYDDVD